MDAIFWHAQVGKRDLRRLHHALRPTEEGMIDFLPRQACPHQGRDSFAIEPAVEQRQILRLAREHVMHGEPAEMPVLEILESVLEHDVA